MTYSCRGFVKSDNILEIRLTKGCRVGYSLDAMGEVHMDSRQIRMEGEFSSVIFHVRSF